MNSKGPVIFSDDFDLVTDADEEIFVLYSELQRADGTDNSQGFRGLGYVDSHSDTIEVKFTIKNVPQPTPSVATGASRRRNAKPRKPEDKVIEIELMQDKTALHSRKGDTGSVVWRASIDFAQIVLQQIYYPTESTLFDSEILQACHVLELGAGTGLLAVALSPLVRQYTATDIGPLIPLIKKNVLHNFPEHSRSQFQDSVKGRNILVEELDWINVESAPLSQRTKIYDAAKCPVDLLLVVDCLYHPSLIPPFLTTVDHLATSGRTAVLIVSELRAEDVMRDFISAWLEMTGWNIWRIPNGDLGKNYVIWLGWKTVVV